MAQKTENPWNEYQKQYRETNPDRARIWRINWCVNHLRRNGYTVIPPADRADQSEERDGE